MKKLMVLVSLMFALSISAFSQTDFSLGFGYSYLQGAINVEVQHGHFGIGAGWFPALMPGDKTLVGSFGAAVSYYGRTDSTLNNADTFWKHISPYGSIGVASAGYRRQMNYGSGWTDDVAELMGIAMVGLKTHVGRFGFKTGFGFGIGKSASAFTWEAGVQFKLLTYTK